MNFLRQSTSTDVGIGPFLDSADGNTPETALTITAPDIRLKKNGGAWAQKNAAQTLSHEEAGWYEVTLDATDTNTLGILIVAIHESGALPVWKDYQVLPANVYDSIVLGSDKLQTDMVEISSDNLAADNAELFFDDTGFNASNSLIGGVGEVALIAANGIDAGSLAVSAGTELGTAVWAAATRTLTAATNITSTGGTTVPQTGDAFAIVNHGTHGNSALSLRIPTVLSAFGNMKADMLAISGDPTAADNLETMLDGTGGKTLTLQNVVINNGAGVGMSITGSTIGMEAIGGTGSGLILSGDYGLSASGITAGIRADSSAGPGLDCEGAGASPGALFTGANAGAGIKAIGGSTGAGLEAVGGSASGDGMHVRSDGSGAGLRAAGDGLEADIVGSIDGNLAGNVVGSVSSVISLGAGSITAASFAAGAINAAAIAPDAIGASELAASAVAEIALGIGGNGAFAITVTINDGAVPLQNVNVSIYDGGGALAGRGTTDASGNASFSLDAGTYTVTLVKANYQFAPASRTVTGNQAGSLVTPMSMAIISPIAASGNPNLCVVAGYIKDLNGNALVGSLVKARLVPVGSNRPITSDGNVLGLEADEAITDALGYVSFELIRTDEIDQPCSYTFKCQDAQMEERNVQLITATLDIATL